MHKTNDKNTGNKKTVKIETEYVGKNTEEKQKRQIILINTEIKKRKVKIMSEKMKEVNLLELEKVTGGTYEELSDIIGLFRKYGYNAEADKLYRSGSVLFEVGFREVMQSMGYKGGMQVYGSPDEANRYVYNDKWASHGTVMNALEEFLKLKKSGLYDM